jgi:membrane-associated phospholipid phosphatase
MSCQDPVATVSAALRRARGETFFRRPTLGLAVGVALITLIVLIGALIPARPLAIDERWSEWMTDIASDALRDLALVFNYLGRGLGRTLSLAAIGVALLLTRRWWALLAFTVAESLAPLATNVLKHLVDRPRPPNAMLHATGSSFPSGHAAYAGATAIALVLLFTRAGNQRLVWWSVAALAIATMAGSRTYLQVHWLSDALAGALLGIGVTLTSFAASQIVQARSQPKDDKPASGTPARRAP